MKNIVHSETLEPNSQLQMLFWSCKKNNGNNEDEKS